MNLVLVYPTKQTFKSWFFFSQLNRFLKCWLYLLVRQNNLEVILKNTIVKNCLEKGPIFACKICLKEGQKLLWIEWIRWVVASYFKNCLKKGPIFACKICLKEGQNFAHGPNCWDIIQIHRVFSYVKNCLEKGLIFACKICL